MASLKLLVHLKFKGAEKRCGPGRTALSSASSRGAGSPAGGLGGPQDASPSSPPHPHPVPIWGHALSAGGVRPTMTPRIPGWTPQTPPPTGVGGPPVDQYSVNSFGLDCWSSSFLVLKNDHCPQVFFWAVTRFCPTELPHLCRLLLSPGRGRPGLCVEIFFFFSPQ